MTITQDSTPHHLCRLFQRIKTSHHDVDVNHYKYGNTSVILLIIFMYLLWMCTCIRAHMHVKVHAHEGGDERTN